MPANLNGSARPDGNPKPIAQDQSPERGCGSYSRCVALVRRGFVSSKWFSLFHKCPTQGNVGLLFWLVSYTISAFLFVQNMPEISLTSPLVYGNIHHADGKTTKTGGKNNVDRRNNSGRNKHFHYWVKHYEEPSTLDMRKAEPRKSPCGGMAKRCSI